MTVPDWRDAAWLAGAHGWIHATLTGLGLSATGAIEQPHVRTWSTVLRVPVAGGALYFKAVPPAYGHEIPITLALHRWRPQDVLPVLATDAGRGCMLLPDGGPRLREQVQGEQDLGRWLPVLSAYAALQCDVTKRSEALLAMGAPDRRTAGLAGHYAGLIEMARGLRVTDPDEALTQQQHASLDALAPRVAEWCAALAGAGVTDSLNHGDLHDGNIFARGARHAFFDWGDCSVCHPFFSMRTVLVSLEHTLGLAPGSAGLDRARDAYLEPWTRAIGRAALLDVFAQSQVLAPLVSALTWARLLPGLAGDDMAAHARAVHALLREFLDRTAPAAG